MLQDFYTPYNPNETQEQADLREIQTMIGTLTDAQDMLLALYGDCCEADRLLQEHQISRRLYPEDKSGRLSELLASIYQVKLILTCQAEDIEHKAEKVA